MASFDNGLAVRKEVLGEEYVDAAFERATEFSMPMQQLVTEYCWGEIWTREALDRRTRSLVNLAMLTPMNRLHELAVHTRGAINNGCTVSEIREVLLQTAIYCGVPAAMESFRTVERVLDEMGVTSAKPAQA